MPIQTNKNIIITPGRSGFTTTISQIDFKWTDTGIGTYTFERNVYDLRSTIYNWVIDEEPCLLFGGMGTVLGQQYFSGPFPDYVGNFTGVSTFPYIKIYPISGQIYTKTLYTSGISSINSISLSSSLFDAYGSSGSQNQILSSIGLGIAWTTPAHTGIVTGSGLTNQVAFWNGVKSISGAIDFVYQNSKLGVGTITPITKLHLSGSALISATDGREEVNIPALHLDYSPTSGLSSLGAGRISAANWGVEYKSLEFEANKFSFLLGDAEFLNISANSFAGFGTSITQLNASNLSQGTVPTARISGSYSGITSVGSLSQLSVLGLTTSFGYFGFGTSIIQLNASNLSQGTVDSNRISGSYSGITSVGSLTQLNISGLTTSLGYFGFGTSIMQLDASNLSQGIVPTARISGSYSGITSVGSLTQLNISGLTTSLGYFGFGTFLIELSASNLSQGTVDSNRISGSYSGITSVGTLSQLNISGLTTSLGYFGFGTSITQLNASNLSQGVVPTARISGDYIGITSVGTQSQLSVSGSSFLNSVKLSILNDSNNSAGLINQVLSSNGVNATWTSISSVGIITGLGSINSVPKFSDTKSIINSNITDNGSIVNIDSNLNINGITTSIAYFGFGTSITELDADNLSQGIVLTDRISGSYSGITSVGTLSQLNISGLTTSLGYFGFGTFLTQLNASNLSQGTVPTGTMIGTYSGITSVGSLTQLRVLGITTSVSYFGFGTSITQLNATNLSQGTVPTARISGSYASITAVGTLTKLNVTGLTTARGFFGFGTGITQINATNLVLGTVPAARITGDYTGITSVGSLSQLNVIGLTTSLGYFGFGTFVTQLNATNLSQGTVPAARIAGDYTGITSVGTQSQFSVLGPSYLGFINASSDALINGVTIGLGSQNLSSNTVLGKTAFANNISGSSNVIIGNFAGQYVSSSSQSVAIGYNAMVGSIATPVTGNNNTAVGYNAMAAATTGGSNNAFGYNAMSANTDGVVNCAFGANSLTANISGYGNAAFGNNTLQQATSSQNTAIGYIAGATISANGDLAALGYSAARYVVGSGNVAVGSAALVGTDAIRVTGSYNIGIGYYAGSAASAGAFNTYLGFYSGGLPGGSYQIAIGREVVVTTDNAGCWGANVNSQRTDLGVGVYSPLARVHINTLSAGNKGLIIDGASSQTANLLEINSSIGTNFVKVGADGQWGFGTAVLSSSGWSASTATPSKSIADGASLSQVINYLATLAEELRLHGIIKS